MRALEVMLSDGAIGNRAILLALSVLTTGNLNSKLKQGKEPFTIRTVLPSTHDYIIPPLTDEEKADRANRSLLTFMAMAPGAPSTFTEKLS